MEEGAYGIEGEHALEESERLVRAERRELVEALELRAPRARTHHVLARLVRRQSKLARQVRRAEQVDDQVELHAHTYTVHIDLTYGLLFDV